MDMTYAKWFEATTQRTPRAWQARLGDDRACRSRLIRVPTGMGKTLGVVGAWAYHRLVRGDALWPRRLVFVLPMRVLVEQCAEEIRTVLRIMGRYATTPADLADPDRVGVHLLMGGLESDPWHVYPERNAVLIGTQDMLLSRALNRGYAAPRARWPMEYALVHQDALWVLDEVQLMGVGFATSQQLQAFRDAQSPRALRPVHSWWMSATLQPSWLRVGALAERVESLREDAVRVEISERQGGPFDAEKSLQTVALPRAQDPKQTNWALQVLEAHRQTIAGEHGRITLAVCNTVDDAVGVYTALKKAVGKDAATSLHLVHSRFRGIERAGWRQTILSRAACTADADRIIVATQVVEAGVDVSAAALVTQLAPWPSLVQRFGRAGRYGGAARVVVVDRDVDEKSAQPYTLPELQAAREAIDQLSEVGLRSLEEFEQRIDLELVSRLYPYQPLHVLTRRQHDELFDTDPDLTGSDLDVSRFIREGEERDVLLWWAPLSDSATPAKDMQPTRDDLCRVSVERAVDFFKKLSDDDARGAVWLWDHLDGAYRRVRARELRLVYPGQTFLVDAACGGYDPELGFTGQKRDPKKEPPVPCRDGTLVLDALTAADLEQQDDRLSKNGYRTIATHGRETAERAHALAEALALPVELREVVVLAARLHDVGKAHPVFQAAIEGDSRPARLDLAKAPEWRRPHPYSHLGQDEDRSLHRPGFRHELASTLMIFELLAQADPYHPALLGPHRELVALGLLHAPAEHGPSQEGPLQDELKRLSAIAFSLAAYLVCAHHGKVRAGWRASPQDQEVAVRFPRREPPLRGVAHGDRVPAVPVAAHATVVETPALTLDLSLARLGLSDRYGASWSERVAILLQAYGPHTLALLETLLRVADVRASAECIEDDVLLEARS